jgi:hypothetical protein
MYNLSSPPPFNISQSRASIHIEELVLAIEQSSEPAFNVSYTAEGYEQVASTSLSERFRYIQQLMDIYTDYYDYSEHLLVFRRACQDIALERSPSGPVCLDATGFHYLSFAQSMNALTYRIRQLIRDTEFQRKAHDRRYQAKQKTATLEHYVRSVLDRYSRTVVVRIDLHYLAIVDPLLRIEHLLADLETLIRARERNPIFEHETGYIWSVEQGKDKGFHVHAAFFFNGAQIRSDWCKAREIGELWQQITSGRGYFFSCNDDKDKYMDVGIGTIKRADALACDNVVKAMSYLAKESQHLRLKPTRTRTFGTGKMPS